MIIYPNTVKKILKWTLFPNTYTRSVEIFNETGTRLLFKCQLKNHVTINKLLIGTYVLKVETNYGEFTQTFTKNKTNIPLAKQLITG